jgi:hypothetical protein
MNNVTKVLITLAAALMLIVPTAAAADIFGNSGSTTSGDVSNEASTVYVSTYSELAAALTVTTETKVIVTADITITSTITVVGTHSILANSNHTLSRSSSLTGSGKCLFSLSAANLTIGGGSGMLSIDGGAQTINANETMINVPSGSELTLKSNAALQNNCINANLNGGAVRVSGGAFVMNGGAIIGNTANNGGAVYVELGGSFIMNDGSITGNTANGQSSSGGNGGAVAVSGYSSASSFTMNGGSITGNTAEYKSNGNGNGGAVYLFTSSNSYAATFTMTNGTISGNTALGKIGNTNKDGSGDAIYLADTRCSCFIIDGSDGTITIASRTSGATDTTSAIYVPANGSIAVTGTVALSGKVNVGSGATVAVLGNSNFSISLVQGSSTGTFAVTNGTYSPHGTFADGVITIVSVSDDYIYINPNGGSDSNYGTQSAPVKTFAGAYRALKLRGITGEGVFKVLGTVIVADNETLSAGNFSPTVDGSSAISTGCTKVVIQRAFSGGAIVSVSGTLILGNVEINGMHTAANASDAVDDAKESAVLVLGGGSFTLGYGASIVNNYYLSDDSNNGGGAVRVGAENNKAAAIFTMEAGSSISGNQAKNGGAVRVLSAGSFVMNGGTISGNTATNNASAVSLRGGTTDCQFVMNGGTISGNTAGTDSVSSANTARAAVQAFNAKAGVIINGGTIADNISTNTLTYGLSTAPQIFIILGAALTVNGGTIDDSTSVSGVTGTVLYEKAGSSNTSVATVTVSSSYLYDLMIAAGVSSSGTYVGQLVENRFYDYDSAVAAGYTTVTVSGQGSPSISTAVTVRAGYGVGSFSDAALTVSVGGRGAAADVSADSTYSVSAATLYNRWEAYKALTVTTMTDQVSVSVVGSDGRAVANGRRIIIGETLTVSAAAVSGYQVASLTVDGVPVSSGATKVVSDDIAIIASAALSGIAFSLVPQNVSFTAEYGYDSATYTGDLYNTGSVAVGTDILAVSNLSITKNIWSIPVGGSTSVSFTATTGLAIGTYTGYVVLSHDGGQNDRWTYYCGTVTFTVTEAKRAAPTITVVTATEPGEVSGLTVDMEYSFDGGAFTAVTEGGSMTGMAAGTYAFRYAADADHALPSKETRVIISPASGTLYVADVNVSVIEGYSAFDCALSIKNNGTTWIGLHKNTSPVTLTPATVGGQSIVVIYGNEWIGLSSGQSTDQISVHIPAGISAGTYTVTIKVTGSNGATATSTLTIVVSAAFSLTVTELGTSGYLLVEVGNTLTFHVVGTSAIVFIGIDSPICDQMDVECTEGSSTATVTLTPSASTTGYFHVSIVGGSMSASDTVDFYIWIIPQNGFLTTPSV